MRSDLEDSKNMFLVKFKNLSYHRCDWMSKMDIEFDKIGKLRLNKFIRESHAAPDPIELERKFSARFLFDPFFLQVERIIRHRINVEEFDADDENFVIDGKDQIGPINENFVIDGKDQIGPIDENLVIDGKDQIGPIDENRSEHDLLFRVKIPSGVNGRSQTDFVNKLKTRDGLPGCLKRYFETAVFRKTKKYLVFVEYLVKWRSLPMTECTWEDFSEVGTEIGANDVQQNSQNSAQSCAENGGKYLITKYAKRKAIEQYLDPTKLKKSLKMAAKRYEKSSDLKRKLKRIGLKTLPTSWHDPKSPRNARPPTLKGGTPFSEWQPPEYKNGNELKRPYQEHGVRWLIKNWHKKVNCILADEMGLGKTIQSIAFTEYLLREFQNFKFTFLKLQKILILKIENFN
ncbi:Chromodomain helicase DNA binding protein, variant 2 [Bonamia ostreae]